MYIYNLNVNKKGVLRLFVALSLTIIAIIMTYSIYIVFFNNTEISSGCVKKDEIIEITEYNYADILKASNENIDFYIGKKVHVIGYVYRLLDFNKSQFVIARDMKYGDNLQSIVVGFLSEYKKASNFPDGAWVEVIGEIKLQDLKLFLLSPLINPAINWSKPVGSEEFG